MLIHCFLVHHCSGWFHCAMYHYSQPFQFVHWEKRFVKKGGEMLKYHFEHVCSYVYWLSYLSILFHIVMSFYFHCVDFWATTNDPSQWVNRDRQKLFGRFTRWLWTVERHSLQHRATHRAQNTPCKTPYKTPCNTLCRGASQCRDRGCKRVQLGQMSSLTVKPTPAWLAPSLTEKSPNDDAFHLSLNVDLSTKNIWFMNLQICDNTA